MEFRTNDIVVTDDNENLAKLCCVLEEIFQKGIKSKYKGNGIHMYSIESIARVDKTIIKFNYFSA